MIMILMLRDVTIRLRASGSSSPSFYCLWQGREASSLFSGSHALPFSQRLCLSLLPSSL